MQKFVLGGFVLKDGLLFEPYGDRSFTFSGDIECVGGIVVSVWKRLEAIGDPSPRMLVRTVEYTYNALLSGVGNILRYDSPHPSHNQYHHVHEYDVLNGDTEGTIREVSDDYWPTLGELLNELQRWYYDNYEAITALSSKPT